jgi:hypothetical protein
MDPVLQRVILFYKNKAGRKVVLHYRDEFEATFLGVSNVKMSSIFNNLRATLYFSHHRTVYRTRIHIRSFGESDFDELLNPGMMSSPIKLGEAHSLSKAQELTADKSSYISVLCADVKLELYKFF